MLATLLLPTGCGRAHPHGSKRVAMVPGKKMQTRCKIFSNRTGCLFLPSCLFTKEGTFFMAHSFYQLVPHCLRLACVIPMSC